MGVRYLCVCPLKLPLACILGQYNDTPTPQHTHTHIHKCTQAFTHTQPPGLQFPLNLGYKKPEFFEISFLILIYLYIKF